MAVLERLLTLLAVLLVGTALRWLGILVDRRIELLNSVTYNIALPALIFTATYDRSLLSVLTGPLLEGLVIVVLGTVLVGWVLTRGESTTARRSVALVQSYHANIGYLGLPLVAATFSDHVTAIASVILGVVALMQVPLTIIVLSSMNDSGAQLHSELRQLLTNPVLVSLVLGLAVGTTGVGVPTSIAGGLDAIGDTALWLALLCVGGALSIDRAAIDPWATARVVAVKIAWMPLFAWLVFSVLAVDHATFTASVVLFGTPTAVSTYVYSSELGGDDTFASINVFVTTVLSIGSLFVLIRLVQ